MPELKGVGSWSSGSLNMDQPQKGVPSAESSRSVRGLRKGVSGKPYPRLCNARRPGLDLPAY